MTVLLVLAGLALLLTLACVWESRSGRPEWGTRTGRRAHDVDEAARLAKAATGAAALGGLMAVDGGDG